MKSTQIHDVTGLGPLAGSGVFDLATDSGYYVTVTDLARYWKVSVDTVYRDIKKGALRAYRVGSSGKIRVRLEDARRYGRPAE